MNKELEKLEAGTEIVIDGLGSNAYVPVVTVSLKDGKKLGRAKITEVIMHLNKTIVAQAAQIADHKTRLQALES